MIELVDMCSLQSPATVDFEAMAKSGIRGVWFKATQYSGDVDNTMRIGVIRARAAGLHCGVYHFCYCGRDPYAQMVHFWKNSVVDGVVVGSEPGDLPPMIDWEYAERGDDGQVITELDTVKWLEAAAPACKKLWYPDNDRKPTIYTYPDFARQHQPFLGKSNVIGDYPLTLACYPNLLPAPKPWDRVTVHQYIGNGGRVPGVTNDCDRDRFQGDDGEFDAFLGFPKDVTEPVSEFSGGIIHVGSY